MAKSRGETLLIWGGVVLMVLGESAICGLSERAMHAARYPVVPLAIACVAFFSGMMVVIRAVKRDESADK